MAVTRTLSRITVGAAAAGSTASGAIVVFDFNPDVRLGIKSVVWVSSLDFGARSFSQTYGYTNTCFSLGNYGYLGFYGLPNFTVGRANGVFNDLRLFNADEVIDAGTTFISFSYTNYSGIPVGTFYLGLRDTQDAQTRYGWLEFTHENSGVYVLNRFAFETTSGQSILAGQTGVVPEASTLGFAGGLFGLVAAAHLRRRKSNQAAASDKFLALAAGERLN